jgi:hypothetical protein
MRSIDQGIEVWNSLIENNARHLSAKWWRYLTWYGFVFLFYAGALIGLIRVFSKLRRYRVQARYSFLPEVKCHYAKAFRLVFSFAMLVLLTACATPLITNTPEFEAHIRRDVPFKDETIIFRHEASLILESDGFDFFDLVSERLSIKDGSYFQDKVRPNVPFSGGCCSDRQSLPFFAPR